MDFVTVSYAPYEVEDRPITSLLSQYGTVLGIRHGHWQLHPQWENGMRHVRMHVDKAIPSYVWVGGYQLKI